MGGDAVDDADLEAFLDGESPDLAKWYRGSDPDQHTLPDKAMLTLVRKERGWQMFYTPNPEHTSPAIWGSPAKYSSAPLLLVEADEDRRAFVTYPINTSFGHLDYLRPKYDQLRSISIEGASGLPPAHIGELVDYLAGLPSGFVKGAEYGLGLHKELNYIVEAIEQIEGVTDLWIGCPDARTPIIDGGTYTMSWDEFHDARKALQRAHSRALSIAADEKRVYLHNTLLHKVDPARFPIKLRSYRKDLLRDAIGNSLAAKPRLSAGDADVLMGAVKATAASIADSKPKEIMELGREIEIVTLRVLIDRMRDLLSKGRQESAWQSFFAENPFVLRLAFGFPVVVIGDNISVGGAKLDGSGGKIADFAAKAVSTGNLALIEIKTPNTALLEARPYRGDLYGPSRDLSGAINQVLDQRYRLQTEINAIKVNSRRYDLESYAIRALVIVGTTPSEPTQQKSFELFRHSFQGVTVVTYDELLTKLEQLLEFLQPSSTAALAAGDADASPSTDSEADDISGLL